MAILKGIARNYNELFTKIHTGLLGAGWRVQNKNNEQYPMNNLLTQTTEDGDYKYNDVIYKGVGFIDKHSPYFKIRYIWNDNIQQYALILMAMRHYSNTTQEVDPNYYWHFVSFDYQNLEYHIAINSRRIVANFIQNVKIQNFYVGFFLPLMKPTEYQYPFYIGASQSQAISGYYSNLYEWNHSSTDSNRSSNFMLGEHDRYSSNYNLGELIDTDNKWKKVYRNYAKIYAFKSFVKGDIELEAYKWGNNIGGEDETFYPNFTKIDNLVMLERIYLAVGEETNSQSLLGSFDGAFQTYGVQQPNDILTTPDGKFKILACNNFKNYFWAIEDI